MTAEERLLKALDGIEELLGRGDFSIKEAADHVGLDAEDLVPRIGGLFDTAGIALTTRAFERGEAPHPRTLLATSATLCFITGCLVGKELARMDAEQLRGIVDGEAA